MGIVLWRVSLKRKIFRRGELLYDKEGMYGEWSVCSSGWLIFLSFRCNQKRSSIEVVDILLAFAITTKVVDNCMLRAFKRKSLFVIAKAV